MDVIILGWIGGQPVEDPYVLIGQIATMFYFSFFIVFIPLIGTIERLVLKMIIATHIINNARDDE
jgi:quinol-cytochrome oxidoreductase complex cytochrome b subunit